MTTPLDNFSRELAPVGTAMAELSAHTNGAAVVKAASQSIASCAKNRPTFRESLTQLINQYSKENSSNTPDYLLANFLIGCMDTFDLTVSRRDEWFGRENKISTTGKL